MKVISEKWGCLLKEGVLIIEHRGKKYKVGVLVGDYTDISYIDTEDGKTVKDKIIVDEITNFVLKNIY